MNIELSHAVIDQVDLVQSGATEAGEPAHVASATFRERSPTKRVWLRPSATPAMEFRLLQ